MSSYRDNDITHHIKNMNIKEARDRKVFITEIDCRIVSSATRRTIDRNINNWVKKNNILLNEKNSVEKYSYGGAAYNGRTLTGRSYKKERIFSNFCYVASNDDGYVEGMKFRIIYSDEIEKYKTHKNFDTKNVPTMLQIAFGLIKKYKGERFEIKGFITGINEPNEFEKQIYKL
ncbi:hypothetical protein [Psychrobacter piscatorii]|uniref:hypothetical protein n=1 Tax=Psychrobacter piscatorii TaxID=554343 RepID=UPI001917CA30|nr:hypothetical protein [Psychrobacter piscatorii]